MGEQHHNGLLKNYNPASRAYTEWTSQRWTLISKVFSFQVSLWVSNILKNILIDSCTESNCRATKWYNSSPQSDKQTERLGNCL